MTRAARARSNLAGSIIAQAEWGLYWTALAARNPALAAACHHNAHMAAMHILAMESAN